MKLYDFFMLLENLEAFRTAKGVPLACQKFIRIDLRLDFIRICRKNCECTPGHSLSHSAESSNTWCKDDVRMKVARLYVHEGTCQSAVT